MITKGVDWDQLSSDDKLLIADAAYNGGGGKAGVAADSLKQVGSISNYDEALKYASNTSNTKDSLRRLDLVYGTDYAKQYAKSQSKKNQA